MKPLGIDFELLSLLSAIKQPPARGDGEHLRTIDTETIRHRHTARKHPMVVTSTLTVCTVVPKPSKYMPHQGRQEIARRQRQEVRRG